MSNKKTTKQFIEESKSIYGDIYDYSDTEYKGRDKPVTLKCKLHGSFTVSLANNHLRKNIGCTLCKRLHKGMEKIREHYDVSKYIFEDTNLHTTIRVKDKQDLFIKIICKNHGFCREEHLRNVVNGSIKNLCKSCLTENKEKERQELEIKKRTIRTYPTPVNKLSIDTVKKRCNESFGYNISFDNMVYVNAHKSFYLQCNIHNHYFNVVLHKIKTGDYGCRYCKKDISREKTKQEFLQKSLEKHGDRYDYSNMDFINMSTHIKIVCPVHRNV